MDAVNITEAELLAAIEEAAGSVTVEGRTTMEWSEFWHCSRAKADLLLQKAFQAGVLDAGRAPRMNRAGAWVNVPVYRIRRKG